MGQRAFGPGEINQGLGLFETDGQISGDRNAAGLAQKCHRIRAQGGAGQHVQCTGQFTVRGTLDGFDQHLAHAARGTRDGHTMGQVLSHGRER